MPAYSTFYDTEGANTGPYPRPRRPSLQPWARRTRRIDVIWPCSRCVEVEEAQQRLKKLSRESTECAASLFVVPAETTAAPSPAWPRTLGILLQRPAHEINQVEDMIKRSFMEFHSGFFSNHPAHVINQVEDMIKRSFMEFHTQRLVPELKLQVYRFASPNC